MSPEPLKELVVALITGLLGGFASLLRYSHEIIANNTEVKGKAFILEIVIALTLTSFVAYYLPDNADYKYIIIFLMGLASREVFNFLVTAMPAFIIGKIEKHIKLK